MANLFSHPFRLSPTNKIVTVDQDSDQYLAERLSIIVQTRPGERPMADEFGIDDPVFGEVNLPDLEFQIELFELPIIIDSLDHEDVSNERTNYLINFHRNERPDEEQEDD